MRMDSFHEKSGRWSGEIKRPHSCAVVRVKFRRAAEEMISLISPPFRISEISGVHLNVSSKFALRVDCERTTRRSAEYKHKQRKK
jgi:hypothetical protein